MRTLRKWQNKVCTYTILKCSTIRQTASDDKAHLHAHQNDQINFRAIKQTESKFERAREGATETEKWRRKKHNHHNNHQHKNWDEGLHYEL